MTKSIAQETKYTTVQALNIGKAKGPDGLRNLPLKRPATSISKSLELVLNTFGDEHNFPIYWKTVSIFPLFKGGDKQSLANYILITVLNCISKILELLIFDKLCEVLCKFIAPQQYGFTKYKSTMTQMVLYLSELFENQDLTQLETLYLDFEKAFDKVCHEKLIEKLRVMGIAGGALTLLKS